MEIGAETPHEHGRDAEEMTDVRITDDMQFWKVEPGSPRPSWVDDTFQEEGLVVGGNEVLRVLLEDGEEAYVHPGDYLFRYGDGDYRAYGKNEFEQGVEALVMRFKEAESPNRPPSQKDLRSQYQAYGYVMSRRGVVALAEALAEGLSDEARETVAGNVKAAFVDQKLFPQEECFGIVSDALQNHRKKAEEVEDFYLVDVAAGLADSPLPDWIAAIEQGSNQSLYAVLKKGYDIPVRDGGVLVLRGDGRVDSLESLQVREGGIFSERYPEVAAAIRREGLERLWAEFGKLPFEENKEGVQYLMKDEGWKFDKYGFKVVVRHGQDRQDVLRWFDDRYPGGVQALISLGEKAGRPNVPNKREKPRTPESAEREARRASAGCNTAKRGPIEAEKARKASK